MNINASNRLAIAAIPANPDSQLRAAYSATTVQENSGLIKRISGFRKRAELVFDRIAEHLKSNFRGLWHRFRARGTTLPRRCSTPDGTA